MRYLSFKQLRGHEINRASKDGIGSIGCKIFAKTSSSFGKSIEGGMELRYAQGEPCHKFL